MSFARPLSLLLVVLAAFGVAGTVSARPWDIETREPTPPAYVRVAGLAETIPALLLEQVNKALPGSITPRRIAFEAPSSVVLEDAVLLHPDGSTVATVARLKADVKVGPLFRGDVVITELDVYSPSLKLKRENGKLNIVEALVREKKKKGGEAPPDITISLEKVVVREGKLSYREPAQNLVINADGLVGEGHATIEVKDATVDVVSDRASASKFRLELPEVAMDCRRVVVESTRLDLKAVRIGAGSGRCLDGEVELKGRVGFDAPGLLALSGRYRMPKGAYPERVAPLEFSLPETAGTLDISGTFEKPKVRAIGSAGAVTAYGYAISSGKYDVRVEKDRVEILSALGKLGDGSVSVSGQIGFEGRTLALTGRAEDVRLVDTLGDAKPDEPISGKVGGQFSLRGTYGEASTIAVEAELSASRPRGFGLTLPTTKITAVARVTPDLVTLDKVALRGSGLVGNGKGSIALKQKKIALDVDGSVANPLGLLKEPIEHLEASGAVFRGRLEGPYDKVGFVGNVTVEQAKGWGVPTRGLSTALSADSKRVLVDKIVATVAEGKASGRVEVKLGKKQNGLAGSFLLDGPDLALLENLEGENLGLGGRVRGELALSGTDKAPVVEGPVAITDLVVAEQPLGFAQSALIYRDNTLVLERVLLRGALAQARSNLVTLDFDDDRLSGRFEIASLDVSRVAAARDSKLTGHLAGHGTLAGAIANPRVLTRVGAKGLSVGEILLGDGPLAISLVPGKKLDDGNIGHIVQLSGRLESPRGAVEARVAYAIERESVNAEAKLRGVDLGPWLTELKGAPEVNGTVSGRLTARGPIASPQLTLSLFAPEISIPPPPESMTTNGFDDEGEEADVLGRTRREIERYVTRGPVRLDAAHRNGRFTAVLCAFPDEGADPYGPCAQPHRVFADVEGTLALDGSELALEIQAGLEERSLQAFVPALASSGVVIGADGRAHLRVSKVKDADPSVEGVVEVRALDLVPSDGPAAHLDEAGFINIDGGLVQLERPFNFAVGEKNIRVGGSVDLDKELLTAGVEGELALSLLRLFTDELTAAAGSVSTRVSMTGSFDNPQIDGCVTPLEGASVTPRTLGRRVVLKAGKLCLLQVATLEGRQRVEAQDLAFLVDDGVVTLDGDVELKYGDGEERLRFLKWDLATSGTQLPLRTARSWAELAFELSLVGTADAPELSGRVEVTEGLVRDSFELKSFVVSRKPSPPSRPLTEQLADYDLGKLLLDVDIMIQDFRTQADVATFKVDSSMRGDLHLGASVAVPAITGALEVTEGYAQFPHATFEIEQTQIEFQPRADGRLNPNLYLFARTELEPPKNGLDTEVPVTLTLDGEFERMRLALEAEDSDFGFSQNDLLMHILFGVPLRTEKFAVENLDPNTALRAVSSELSSVLTREIEDSVASEFGTRLKLNVFYEEGQVKGGLSYQLGERVEFEGLGGFSGAEAAVTDGTSPSAGSAEARLRLLVFDHLPVLGRELAFEGEIRGGSSSTVNAPTSNLRLSLRLLEL